MSDTLAACRKGQGSGVMAPSSRDRISVDLRGLKAALFERSRAQGVTPSNFVRSVLERRCRPSSAGHPHVELLGARVPRTRLSLRVHRDEARLILAARAHGGTTAWRLRCRPLLRCPGGGQRSPACGSGRGPGHVMCRALDACAGPSTLDPLAAPGRRFERHRSTASGSTTPSAMFGSTWPPLRR